MTALFWIHIAIDIGLIIFFIRRQYNNKPITNQLADEIAKRKTMEEILNVINKKLPKNQRDRIDLLNTLSNGSNKLPG